MQQCVEAFLCVVRKKLSCRFSLYLPDFPLLFRVGAVGAFFAGLLAGCVGIVMRRLELAASLLCQMKMSAGDLGRMLSYQTKPAKRISLVDSDSNGYISDCV